MSTMVELLNKPHIQRAPPYDGDGWICYAFGDMRGTGFGATPCEAYRDWLDPDSAFKYWTQGAGARARLGIPEKEE